MTEYLLIESYLLGELMLSMTSHQVIYYSDGQSPFDDCEETLILLSSIT